MGTQSRNGACESQELDRANKIYSPNPVWPVIGELGLIVYMNPFWFTSSSFRKLFNIFFMQKSLVKL
jgi:hypothetical protein